MKTPRTMLWLSFSAFIAVAIVPYLAAMSRGARSLSDDETRSILGAGVQACDQGKGDLHAGWTCLTTGSFACDNVCDVCPQQTTMITCRENDCWECGMMQIKECSALAGPGCTDMGNIKLGTPCDPGGGGSIMTATCAWDPVALTCSCPGGFVPGARQCPRYNCL